MQALSQPSWVMTVPVISSAHLDRATAEALAGQCIAGCSNPWSLLLMPSTEGGCILFIGDDPIDVVVEGLPEDVPQCIVDIFTRMKTWNYAWVRLDRDADLNDGLPVYDW